MDWKHLQEGGAKEEWVDGAVALLLGVRYRGNPETLIDLVLGGAVGV